jgi:hypothetical protein
MSDMKCPFCGRELSEYDHFDRLLVCFNPQCEAVFTKKDFLGNKNLWQELIRTRKALDVALDWLGQVATPEKCDDDLCREFTKRKLAEIKTALEQKD